MTERKVTRLQREVNETLANRKFPWRRIRVDGDQGPSTNRAAGFAAWLTGFSNDAVREIHDGHINDYRYRILTHQAKRSAAMEKRDKDRRTRAAQLRRQHEESGDADGVAMYGDVPVAAWIVGRNPGPDGKTVNWLARYHEAGWRGGLTSGYRTPEYSESLCYSMCGAPSCPGRCAGRASNHSGKDGSPPGWGAIDVTYYDDFERIGPTIGSPLINRLDWRDPVHFSVTGN